MRKKQNKALEKITEEVEMNQRMLERVKNIEIQTYWYLMQLLDLDVDEAEKNFPRNREVLRAVFDNTISILKEYGHAVCNPYICTPEVGRQYRCTLSECGCKSCSCQDEFMEKERLMSNIEEAIAFTGLKIMCGNKDSIIVRQSRIDTGFEIRVTQLAG